MQQEIRFCRGFDGARLAYAVTGDGIPLVKAPHWLTHLEYEFQSPLWRPWIKGLSRRYRLLRMDERACGLSDWDVADISFDAWVRDLESVVDAAALERFALFGHSQGAAIAIAYAVRHPERVSHLVLLGGYARGAMKRGPPPAQAEELDAQLKLIAAGWGREDPAYRNMFSSQFVPGGSLEHLRSMSEMQRQSASAENARRIIQAFFDIDVSGTAPRIGCPTLVFHARGDRRVPFEEGRLLASLIPGARFVPLETDNHILLPGEPALTDFLEVLGGFLLPAETQQRAAFAELTPREADVLERIAQGLDNAQIAAHLKLSEKTVRNHITSIFDKLAVENRAQAIVRAREHGMGLKPRR